MFEIEIHNQNTGILHCMNAFIEGYEKPNTRRTYTTIITRYINFLAKLHDKAASVDLVVKAGAPEALSFISHLRRCKGQECRNGGSNKISQGTIAKYTTVLRRLYDFLIGADAIEGVKNPFGSAVTGKQKRTKQKRPHRALEPEEVIELINVPLETPADLRDRALLHVLFATGMRRSEVPKIRFCDFKRKNSAFYFTLYDTKSDGQIDQVIADWAVEILERWITYRINKMPCCETDPIFCVTRGKYRRLYNRPMTGNSVYWLFKKRAADIGLEDVSPHCARATAITELLRMGYDAYSITKFSRHKSVDMIGVYDKRKDLITGNVGYQLRYSA